jgi:hypothetical protein
MAKLPTKPQAEVARLLSEIVFKGLALAVVLFLLVVGFFAFLYALFRLERPVSTGILGGMDILLGVLLRQVYGSLFPTKPA